VDSSAEIGQSVRVTRASKRGLIVVLAVGAAGLWAFGMWSYMTHDRVGFIEDSAIVEAAGRACAQMQREIVQAGEKASLPERDIAENEAVLAMVDRIRQVGSDVLDDDKPSEAWLADWERIVEARTTGDTVPTADGQPITERMNDVARGSGIDVCHVPPQLLGA
jgi:hypothetical protein